MEKIFIVTIEADDGQKVPEEALFQVIMNGLASGHPFNLGISSLSVESVAAGGEWIEPNYGEKE